MTVGRSSRDAEGGVRGSGLSHRQVVVGDWFSSPAPVGASAKSLGSRFWVLSSEFEGSDDEIWEVDGAVEGAVGDRSVGSPQPSRTLGDFLGLEQEGVSSSGAPRVSGALQGRARRQGVEIPFSPHLICRRSRVLGFAPVTVDRRSLPHSSCRWAIGPSRCRRRPRHRRSWLLPRHRRQIW
jgi:hypothetical protein